MYLNNKKNSENIIFVNNVLGLTCARSHLSEWIWNKPRTKRKTDLEWSVFFLCFSFSVLQIWLSIALNLAYECMKRRMQATYEKESMFQTLGAGGMSINNELEKKDMRLLASKFEGTSIADSFSVSNRWSLWICGNNMDSYVIKIYIKQELQVVT